jgi:hypothetical protein
LVGPGLVVVAHELAQHSFQVTPTEDQHVVEQLAACGAHPPLREGVGTRGPKGQVDDLDALTAEDLIEGAGELGVPVAEQEPGGKLPIPQPRCQVPSLLDDPLAGRVVGAAGEVNTAAADLDEEEDVEPGQPDGVDGEEVGGQDLVGVLANELAPGALASPRSWRQTVSAEHLADGEVGAAVAELDELAVDTAIAPARVLPGEADDELVQLAWRRWLSSRSPAIRCPLPRTSARCQRSRVSGRGSKERHAGLGRHLLTAARRMRSDGRQRGRATWRSSTRSWWRRARISARSLAFERPRTTKSSSRRRTAA